MRNLLDRLYNEHKSECGLREGLRIMVSDDLTLSPRRLVENYRRAYETLHKRQPVVRYMGNDWYYVNGKTIHRVTLVEETTRLRSQKRHFIKGDKNLLSRLLSLLSL
jgi:hypothetical protein